MINDCDIADGGNVIPVFVFPYVGKDSERLYV